MITSPSSAHGGTAALVDEDTAARVALTAADVTGNAAVSIGIRMFGGASRFVAAVHDQRDTAVPLTPPVRERIRTLATASRVRQILETTASLGLSLLAPHHASWPAQLNAMRAAAPLLLWVRGDESALTTPSIAMTGTTSPSESEAHTITDLATGLASRGWVLVTGAGRGVESLVLRAAETMKSPSVLVSDRSLAEQKEITGCGVQVSELPPGYAVSVSSQRRAKHLVSALAGKVLVDEIAYSSRSLPIVEAARAMRRPVGLIAYDAGSADVIWHRHPEQWKDVQVIRSIRDADWFH